MQTVVALHLLAVLARPKQETIPKYAKCYTKHKDDFCVSTVIANSYGVLGLSAVSKKSIPKELRVNL